MSDTPAQREESLGSYEMLWDCPHCDTKRNLGKTHRHCPNCGAPQDETKRYFPTEADRVKVADHVFTGADRKCASCGTPQSAKASNCGQCGAPIGDAKAVPLIFDKQPIAAPGRRWGWWILVGVLLFSTLIWWRCIRKRDIALQVTGHRWATIAEVEEFREVGDQAWRNELPSDARAVTCRPKQRSTKSVPDGEDCQVVRRDKGDGTFEEIKQCTAKTRQEGIDDDWCDYRADRWTKVDELKQNGTGLTATWAPVPVAGGASGFGASGLGNRRGGAKTAVYTLDFHDGKKARTCDVSEGTWKKYADGQKVKAQVRASSDTLVCGSL